MILSTHAVIGTALAALFPSHPFLAFSAAVASHFLADAIPHWEYTIFSLQRDPHNSLNNDVALDKRFALDLLRFSIDAAAGMVISFLVASLLNAPLVQTVSIGVMGGLLPDALQFVYWKVRREPIRSLQRLHLWIHAKKHLANKPALGISLQIIISAFVIVLVKIIRSLANT